MQREDKKRERENHEIKYGFKIIYERPNYKSVNTDACCKAFTETVLPSFVFVGFGIVRTTYINKYSEGSLILFSYNAFLSERACTVLSIKKKKKR